MADLIKKTDLKAPCTGSNCQIVTREFRNTKLNNVQFTGKCTVQEQRDLLARARKRIEDGAALNFDTCDGNCSCIPLTDAKTLTTKWITIAIDKFTVVDAKKPKCGLIVSASSVEVRLTSTAGLCLSPTIPVFSSLFTDKAELFFENVEDVTKDRAKQLTDLTKD